MLAEMVSSCDQGARYVCGADEAGRACMAGPLVAAAGRVDDERLNADSVARLVEEPDRGEVVSVRVQVLGSLERVVNAVQRGSQNHVPFLALGSGHAAI